MLKAITQSGWQLFLNVDDKEYSDIDLPDNLLTVDELSQVREIVPTALPMYPVKVE